MTNMLFGFHGGDAIFLGPQQESYFARLLSWLPENCGWVLG